MLSKQLADAVKTAPTRTQSPPTWVAFKVVAVGRLRVFVAATLVAAILTACSPNQIAQPLPRPRRRKRQPRHSRPRGHRRQHRRSRRLPNPRRESKKPITRTVQREIGIGRSHSINRHSTPTAATTSALRRDSNRLHALASKSTRRGVGRVHSIHSSLSHQCADRRSALPHWIDIPSER